MIRSTIDRMDADGITVSIFQRQQDWQEMAEALIMAESLLKMFGHSYQASLINAVRSSAMRAATIELEPA